ncbi:MAG TPA: flagellar protein FlbB [Xanthobacteraceae bacterium]|nr:flagellar protein FlbB [Xanthobacteraceae bacterium]
MSGILVRLLRDIRLVPIVLIATVALFALKTLSLVLDAPYLFQHSTATEDVDAPEITGANAVTPPSAPATVPASRFALAPRHAEDAIAPDRSDPDFTGAVTSPATPPSPDAAPATAAQAPPAAAQRPPKKGEEPVPPAVVGTQVPLDEHPVSPSERAILESLQKRRAELDQRSRELDMREDLLKAAEKRVAGRIDELKEIEERVNADLQQKDDAEKARFKNVVTMYESMKAKDAAKIFDGLDMRVLIEVAKAINPRTMSEIMAQMQPENAQRLTVELAARPAPKGAEAQAADLPKIQGTPTPN